MKKLVALVLVCIMVVLSLSACNPTGSNPTESTPVEGGAETKSLYVQGLDVVRRMHEITKNEEYLNILTGDNEINTIIKGISTGDYSTPKAVFAISISDADLVAMAELDRVENASDELKTLMLNRVFTALITQINSISGVKELAASSVCTAGKAFVNENATGRVIYLYTYENARPVAVTFVAGEDNIVSASGVFIMYDGFTCGSVDEIKDFFGNVTVEVTEVLPE